MKHIANVLHKPTEFFKDECNQKILILSVLVFLFLWLLILLASGASHDGEEAVNLDNPAVTSVSVTPGITPTKWWIKMTGMSSPIPSVIRT